MVRIYLGFESRQSLEDYKKKEGFSYPIKKALLTIEKYYEQSITGKNPAGAIFALKNFGWKDKQEIEQKAVIEDKRIDESRLTDDELRILIEIQRKSGIS
jgi:DNA-packaging protein gp3